MADFLQNNGFWPLPLSMSKKKAPKKSKTKGMPPAQPAKEASQAAQPENEERFDFGGLPDRNLKKNLGCG